MNVTSRCFFFLMVLALAGCGSAPQRTPGDPAAAGTGGGSTAPGGAPRHSIACAGGNWADCYEKAGAACGDKGYVVVGHETSASAGASTQRNMMIECRDWSPR
jgi:hypothetical protein